MYLTTLRFVVKINLFNPLCKLHVSAYCPDFGSQYKTSAVKNSGVPYKTGALYFYLTMTNKLTVLNTKLLP